MPALLHLACPEGQLAGKVHLEPSKSLSNRALIIRSLCAEALPVEDLSRSDDTRMLEQMLASEEDSLYAGHAGSAYRFMLARACLNDRPVILDGSGQLRQRPIGPLVDALRALGADIVYLGQPGYPPVRIKPVRGFGQDGQVIVNAGISSQFVSALLLIAPRLPKGLAIHLSGVEVSGSYSDMTIKMMRYFGIDVQRQDNTIIVPPASYRAKPYRVEGDWSGAAYFFALAALAGSATIELIGVQGESWQGDAIVKEIYRGFGIETELSSAGLRLIKVPFGKVAVNAFAYDFSSCPDLAQTVLVTLAGLGIPGAVSGLKTLQWKETHRITAMRQELARTGVDLDVFRITGDVTATLTGRADWRGEAEFDTYGDHRMAMALTALALIGPIAIREPGVVQKSFPDFWGQVRSIGVSVRDRE